MRTVNGRACRHCGKRRVNYPRGLCGPCYEDHSIRHRYPILRCKDASDVGLPSSVRPLAPEPTQHAPGTEGKVAVLCRRAELGQLLWHPADAGRRRRPGQHINVCDDADASKYADMIH